MELLGAAIETVIVLRAAIKVNLQAGWRRAFAHQSERAVAIPEGAIERRAKRAAECARDGGGRIRVKPALRRVCDQRGAIGADRTEKIRMTKRQMQGAVAAHGHAGDSTTAAAFFRAVMRIDEGHHFLNQKILVGAFSVARIDEEGAIAIGRDDQKFTDLHLFPQILREIEAAGVDHGLLVLAEAVQEIQHRVAARPVVVVAGRQQNAVLDFAVEKLAGHGATLGPRRRLRGCHQREWEGDQQKSNARKHPSRRLTHIAEPAQGRGARPARRGTFPPRG